MEKNKTNGKINQSVENVRENQMSEGTKNCPSAHHLF